MTLFEVIHMKVTYILSIPVIAISLLVIVTSMLFLRPKIFIILILFAIASAGVVGLFDTLMRLELNHKPLPIIESRVNNAPCESAKLSDC